MGRKEGEGEGQKGVKEKEVEEPRSNLGSGVGYRVALPSFMSSQTSQGLPGLLVASEGFPSNCQKSKSSVSVSRRHLRVAACLKSTCTLGSPLRSGPLGLS